LQDVNSGLPGCGGEVGEIVTFDLIVSVSPPSRAGSLPQGFCGGNEIDGTTQIHCGSGLAREDGGTSNIDAS